MSERIDVKKTYKLFINGAFPRSESGRTYEVKTSKGAFLANACQSSRKDLREAVVAARAAHNGWSKATAYNRGQILYRIAEMLQARTGEFVQEIMITTGVTKVKAEKEVLQAIDTLVWYAGWSDKLQAVSGATNPVSGPFFNFSISEPQGVVAIASPATFLDFIDSVAAAVVSGNTTVVFVPGSLAVPAMSFAEVLATSDLPAGVINILTGSLDELAPWAASHMDIDGFDISGVAKKKQGALKEAGAENLKRIHSFTSGQSPARILAFMESKTVWHSVGV
jgi:acyl-CoA reductase-like NAD-dependent aldehyde dehydrogenase